MAAQHLFTLFAPTAPPTAPRADPHTGRGSGSHLDRARTHRYNQPMTSTATTPSPLTSPSAETDPVAAVASWTAMRGTTSGPLFTSMRGGHPSRTGKKELEPISGSAVARILKTRAEAAGLPTERITGHSLRAGHATTAAMAGVGIDRIAAQTRHRSITTLIEHYIRPTQALETTSSRDLGL